MSDISFMMYLIFLLLISSVSAVRQTLSFTNSLIGHKISHSIFHLFESFISANWLDALYVTLCPDSQVINKML